MQEKMNPCRQSASIPKALSRSRCGTPAPKEKNGMNHLVFRVGNTRCAVEVDHVREVLPAVALTELPSASATIAGVLELRGDALTVLDLVYLLIGVRRPIGLSQRIAVLQSNAGMYGVLVDEVDDLMDIDTEQAREIEGNAPAWLRRMIPDPEGLILLPDLETLFGRTHEVTTQLTTV
jgi:purine-binding chemotaxis protein CheW